MEKECHQVSKVGKVSNDHVQEQETMAHQIGVHCSSESEDIDQSLLIH